MEQAFKNGQIVPFEEFQKNYHIFGAWENLRDNYVENFTFKLTEEGYKKMVEVIGKYL